MTAADAERWNDRYDGRPLAAPQRPDALTDELADALPTTGNALDVACGAGGQSLWLAERGLDVLSIDVSDTAVSMTRRAAERSGLAERIDARVVDLDAGLPDEPEAFDAIVCQRFRDPRLYDSMVTRLAPGGVAVVTVLSRTGAADPGPFHAPGGELGGSFDRPDLDLLHHVEGDGEESVVVRRRR